VRNIGRGLAISLHVYGTDIGVRGTSINHRFDEPVVTDRPGERVAWRDGAPIA
jgi:hypothetical protein